MPDTSFSGRFAKFFRKYDCWWVFLIYIVCHSLFFVSEQLCEPRYMVHMGLDDRLPFCEGFVVFYVLWYVLVVGSLLWFFSHSRPEFLQLSLLLLSGLVIATASFFLFPTGVNLRPDLSALPRDNIFLRLLSLIYRLDQPENVFPSIHCYYAMGITVACWHAKAKNRRKKILCCSAITVLSALICLSTFLIKQHSVADFLGAAALIVLFAPAVYHIRWPFLKREYPLDGPEAPTI